MTDSAELNIISTYLEGLYKPPLSAIGLIPLFLSVLDTGLGIRERESKFTGFAAKTAVLLLLLRKDPPMRESSKNYDSS